MQYRGGLCRACGYEPTPKERSSQGLEFVGGQLVEIQKKPKKEQKLTCEDMIVSALYKAGRTNQTWKQAIGIAKGLAEKQGTTFRCPSRFEVAGRTLHAIPFGDPDGSRRVASLYDGIFA